MQTRHIFSAATTDGKGNILKVVDDARTDNEVVAVQVTGTWSSVTVNPQISLDYGITSPATWTNVKAVASDGTLADVALTADGTFNLLLPSGAHFSLNITGAGSPLPSITAVAHGDIEAAA